MGGFSSTRCGGFTPKPRRSSRTAGREQVRTVPSTPPAWLCEDSRQATATLLVGAALTFHSPKREKESRQTFLGAQGLNFNRRDLRDLLHRVGGATRSERKPWQKLFRFGPPKGLCCHLVRAFGVSLRTQVRCSRKQPRSAACMSKGNACSV